MIKVFFFAPYPEILPVVQQVFSSRPDRQEFEYEVDLNSFPNLPENITADVIIARGFTAYKARQRGLICAELKVSDYDVVQAIDECLKQAPIKKVAIAGAYNMLCTSEVIRRIFPDLEIAEYPATDEEMLDELIAQAVAEGCDAIVGGYAAIWRAEKYPVIASVIRSGSEAVNLAISEAKNVAEAAIRMKQRSSEISSIMNYSFQGILSTDRNGLITYANSYCHTLLKDVKHTFIGCPIQDFFPQIPVERVISEGYKLLSELQYYNKTLPIIINCVPIEGDHDNMGCVLTFQNAAQIQAQEGKIRKNLHRSGFYAKYHFSEIFHNSPAMKSVISTALNYSYSNSNVLICGETGTGKELFAQSIHNSSSRRNNPFVAINCSALPETLLESELFGYVEGAFTGASRSGKTGFFEIAHTGTIFLDEIGDISPKLQSRLLRVLQEKEINRLGDDTVIPVDVRVISATNKNLKEAVARGEFRQDLLYRLDVLELNLPPLRQRGKDIALLLNHYIQFEKERTGCRLTSFSKPSMDLLLQYSWPGNIREMRNFCERICILCQKETAGLDDIALALPDLFQTESLSTASSAPVPASTPRTFAYDERTEIINTLAMFRNNRTKTAEHMNMHPSTLWRKMKKYGIDTER